MSPQSPITGICRPTVGNQHQNLYNSALRRNITYNIAAFDLKIMMSNAQRPTGGFRTYHIHVTLAAVYTVRRLPSYRQWKDETYSNCIFFRSSRDELNSQNNFRTCCQLLDWSVMTRRQLHAWRYLLNDRLGAALEQKFIIFHALVTRGGEN